MKREKKEKKKKWKIIMLFYLEFSKQIMLNFLAGVSWNWSLQVLLFFA